LGTLQIAEILQEAVDAAGERLQQSATLPPEAVYTFDQAAEQCPEGEAPPVVVKTRRRTVVSLRFGAVRCREVLRRAEGEGGPVPSGLGRFAPAGMRCAYDLIAHIGVEYYLHGNTLGRIREELQGRTPAVCVPLSSLYDICAYFLYLFGQLHLRRAGQVRDALARDGKSVWLLDCTQEADSPAYFGILETHCGVLLGCWKMATENQPDVSGRLRQAVECFGKPGRLLHDLGAVMTASCAEVLPGVPDGVCHFHLARDIGEDLFRRPHKALGERLQSLKLQAQLRGQRQDQVDYLRKQTLRGEAVLLLQRLLAGESAVACWTATLGREVLLAVHFWMLDYAQDGRRQGYPFDPHLLYLHRRLVRAADALQRLFAGLQSAGPLPDCLRNLCRRLQAYRDDQAIQDAAAWYEKAQEVFTQLRRALRLASAGKTPMSEAYEISADEQRDVKREIKGLCQKWRQEAQGCPPRERQLYEIVLSHIGRYEGKLLYEGAERLNEGSDRTTNDLERTWRENKRRCRGRHGRAGVKKDMQVMPAEAMLLGNLEVPEYVEAVLGSWAELPRRLAEVGGGDESFRAWKTRQRPNKIGQLPRALLRRQDFLGHLLQVCLPLPDSP
jgi:hypothetical protein